MRPRDPRPHPLLPAAALLLFAAGCGESTDVAGPVPGLPPAILDVSPDVMEAGETATIYGLNFGATPGENRVTVAGAEAVVESASNTRLRIRLPGAEETPCMPTRRVPVSVTAGRATGTDSLPLSVVPALMLDPGATRTATASGGVRCHNLPSGPREYVVSVFNTNTDAGDGSAVSFEVRGILGAGGEDSPGSASATPARFPATLTVADRLSAPGLRANLRAREAHYGHLAHSLETAGGFREAPSPAEARAGREEGILRGRVAADPVPEVGELIDFRVPSFSGNACLGWDEVTGRVVFTGPTTVVVEDTAAPLAGTMDDAYRSLGQEYEGRMGPIIRENFGDPLVYDEQLDADGHFYMLFTPRVNDLGDVLGFVWSGDFVSRQACGSSDEAEVFYALVPTVSSPGFDFDNVEGWLWQIRPTIIHEVKHIVSFATRFANDASAFESAWLEEATAMVAEELYARELFDYGATSNTGYDASVGCELWPVRSAAPASCRGRPLTMFAHFAFLYDFYDDLSGRSPLGARTSRDVAWLGGGWWLLRWALDHADGPEDAFLRALNEETGLTGAENLAARMGRSFSGMLADWTLALELDDRSGLPQGASPALQVPSWDSRGIFGGLGRDLANGFSRPFPLEVRSRSYSSYSFQVPGLPGGSAALLRVVGTAGASQLLEVRSPSGGAPPPPLGISIARIE